MNKRAYYLIVSLLILSFSACGASQKNISSPTATSAPAIASTPTQPAPTDTATSQAVVAATNTPAAPTSTAVPAPTEIAKHTSAPNSIVEFQITNDDWYQKAPRISGDTLVWFQSEKVNGITTSNVYAYSLSQKTTKLLSKQGIYPVVNGNTIVWSELNNANQNFSLVREAVGGDSPEVLFSFENFDYASPASRFPVAASALLGLVNRDVSYLPYDLSDKYLVWVEIKPDKYTVQAFDFAKTAIETVSDSGRMPLAPRISGSKVYWSDDRGYGVNLYSRDLSAGTEITATQVTGKKMLPAVTGQYLVWLDVTHTPSRIMALNLSTGEAWNINPPAALPSQPRVDGDIVVWSDTRNGNADIYGYYLPTKTEFRITNDPADQVWPDISGNTVVWMDNRGGKWDLWGATLDWK